jgi:hypothetical protein
MRITQLSAGHGYLRSWLGPLAASLSRRGPLWLVRVLSLASYLCDKSRSLGKKVLISVSPERVSLEINDVSVAFKPLWQVFL